MRHFIPLESVPYFAAASSHCFSSISQTLRFPGISDSLDSMRHFIPLESVPYFAAASSHCFSSISQTLRFPGISDSLDSMRHFIPLESVPYLTGSILFPPPQGKKATLLRCALFCINAKKEQYLIYTIVLFLFIFPGIVQKAYCIVQKAYFRNALSQTGCTSGRGSA